MRTRRVDRSDRSGSRSVRVLSRSFYNRPTLTVAEELLGKVLVHRAPGGVAAGMIVETEAYIGEEDPACHAAPGLTKRNAPLYGPPGLAYVYLNYGIHYLVNAVTEAEGHPAAVLIRALHPVEGIGLMKKRRAPDGHHIDDTDLCRGPGNLTRALGLTLSDNLLDLTLRLDSGQASSYLVVEDRGLARGTIAWGSRIGIRVGVERPWRCWIEGHPSVSGPRSRRSGSTDNRQPTTDN
ncbi:MAG: DNA-3-methyladenine glycosylase [Acidobacteria bacterium]|nr:DNA-3-methyladenine glycosylase [Acidobacteriota bacterium]